MSWFSDLKNKASEKWGAEKQRFKRRYPEELLRHELRLRIAKYLRRLAGKVEAQGDDDGSS